MHDRRRFLKTGLAGAGLLLTGPRPGRATTAPGSPTVRAASDRVSLGGSGVRSFLPGLGDGANGGARASDTTRLPQEAFTRVLRHSLDQGVSLLDLADLYGTHPFARTALEGVPRDRYTVLTKIWPNPERSG